MSLQKLYTTTNGFASNCANTFISFLKILLSSTFRIHLPKAKQNSCIVLGNGPSLRQSLLKCPELFRQHALICVNHFALSKEYSELQPGYYVMLDPGLWEKDREDSKKLFEIIIERTTWELQLLLPQKAKNAVAIKHLERSNPNIKINYFNYTVFRGFPKTAHFFYSSNLAMPQSQNVLVATLFLAINMHFKKIILVGADHTWHENLHINESNQLCLKDVHFYENESKVNYRLFYKDLGQKETFTMHEILFTFSKVFYGYQLLKRYADFSGTTIYNASEVSFIDAFERKKMQEFAP